MKYKTIFPYEVPAAFFQLNCVPASSPPTASSPRRTGNNPPLSPQAGTPWRGKSWMAIHLEILWFSFIVKLVLCILVSISNHNSIFGTPKS